VSPDSSDGTLGSPASRPSWALSKGSWPVRPRRSR